MAIVYPLAFPGGDYIEAVRFQSVDAVGLSVSPYTYQQQVYDYQVGTWTVDIDLRFLDRVEAMPIISWLNKLRGQFGTFTMGDVITALPQGVATGTPLVKGASQTGFSLITDGWTNSTTNILKAGDFFQINNYLYRNLTDVNSNGSGNATLDIWPHLKSHADNSSIVTGSPKGLWRLNKGTQVSQLIDKQKTFVITVSADEAL